MTSIPDLLHDTNIVYNIDNLGRLTCIIFAARYISPKELNSFVAILLKKMLITDHRNPLGNN